MNHDDIKKILNDLYILDPSLQSHEKELIGFIRAMAIKPEAYYDPAFAATLRAQLLAKLSATLPSKHTLSEVIMSRPVRYAAAAIAVVAIAAVVLTTLHPKSDGGTVALNAGTLSITDVGPNAFGTLNALSSAGTGAGAGTTANTNATAPQNSPAAMPATMVTPTTGNAATPAEIAMPLRPIEPPNVRIEYTYTGSPFVQGQSSLNVLKKIAQPLSAGQATTALEQAGFGQINLSSFSGLAMSNVTLSQDQSFGYDISLDFTDGTISIDQDYNEWPQGDTTALTASEIPSNSAVIAIANQFLSAHSIATTTYGAPQVSPTNTITPVAVPMGASGASASAYVPVIPYFSDSEAVIYPLIVNGQNVYDTNGNAIGITVDVNVRYNRVSDVYGLDTESYQASAYNAITSTSTILSMAETPSFYPILYHNMTDGSVSAVGTGGTITTLDLGTPTMAYEDMYQTDSNGQSTEFLVPAFAFPVMSSPASEAESQIIMVPLISEFAQQNNYSGQVIPYNAPTSDGGPVPAPAEQ